MMKCLITLMSQQEAETQEEAQERIKRNPTHPKATD
jgi:hypothetical protein